jgi:TPR repeat protein
MKKQFKQKKHFRHMTPRSFLPVAIAGGFAAVLLIVLAVFMHPTRPAGPSQEELAADYANGLKYERGDNVTVNYQTAMDWYRKAADGGYAQAELSLGIMYMAGRGTPKDPKQAVDWFRRGAEHGLPEAQVQLAGDTLSGLATADGKPDKVEAEKWLLLGGDGVTDPLMKQVAISQRAALEAELTADERTEAQKRADAWRKQHASQE